MAIDVVVNKLTDALRSDFQAAFAKAKQLAGITEPITLHEQPYYGEGVTVGLGVPGYDFQTLSPKQVVTRGLGVSFLQQTLQQAKVNRRGEVPLTEGVNYTVLRTPEDLDLDFTGKTIALDIEVSGNIRKQPWATGRLLAISIYDGQHCYIIPEILAETRECADLIERILSDLRVTVVTWNGTFDIPILVERLGLDPKLHDTHDAMLMHYALYNTAGEHGLKPVARRFLGAPDWDADNAKYTKGGGHFERIPRQQLYYYAGADVYYTYLLFLLFYENLENNPRVRAIYQQRMIYSAMLQEIQHNGIPVDLDKMAELREAHVIEREAALRECREIAGDEKFNPGSPKQVKSAIAALGVEVAGTGKEPLKQARREHPEIAPLIDALFKYRAASKVIGSYIDNVVSLVGEDGKVHPSYKPHGAVTGRLSATSPAIQTIPRGVGGVRSAFRVQDDDHVIVQCDFSQAELRTVAELSDDKGLIEAFAPGAPDFFDNLMTKIYADEFPTIETYKSFAKENPAAAENKRALVKGTVYGCVPIDTKILTRRGLLYFDQLLPGDETWSHLGRWTEITGCFDYSSAPLVRYKNQSYNFVVTPNHRWPAFTNSTSAKDITEARIKPLSELTKSSLLLMCPQPEVQAEPIACDPATIVKIRSGILSVENVLNLSPGERLWLAQNLRKPSFSARFGSKEAVQVLGYLQGYHFTYHEYEKARRFHNKASRVTRLSSMVREEISVEEPVFCLTTEDETWTMYQNDQLIVTGNSNYGRSVPAIAKALNIPVTSAQGVMDSYYGAYPGLATWQQGVREAVGKPELRWRLTTPYGMQFVREVVSGYNRNSAENEALASVPQSTANEITLRAAVEVHNRLNSYPEAHIVALVHDNIAVMCRKEDAENIGKMMEREMRGAAYTAGFFRVPFVTSAEYGNSLDH